MSRPDLAKPMAAAALLGVMGPVAAQDAVHVQPRSYRVVLDNQDVRVLEFNAKPGMGVCGTGLHSHPAHVTVLLSPQRVLVRQGGRTLTLNGKAGDAFYEPPVTHEVENIGGTSARSLVIELKHGTGR